MSSSILGLTPPVENRSDNRSPSIFSQELASAFTPYIHEDKIETRYAQKVKVKSENNLQNLGQYTQLETEEIKD